MWYKEAPKKSFIGRQVVVRNSMQFKKGDILTISGWHDTHPGVIFVKSKNGVRTTINVSRVDLLDSNESAVGLLKEGH